MSLEKLKEIKLEVEKELLKFFDDKISNVKDDTSKEVLEFLKDFTLRGGKRIRAGMLVYGYACFKEIDEDIIKAAISMELIQTYLLIHDDIMDKDDLRRGKDSMHMMYEKKYNVKNVKHFGISQAINVGDLSNCLANEVLTSLDFNDKIKIRAIGKMNEVLEKVVNGQILDILNENRDDVKEEDVLKVYRLKSASYTIEGPLQVGAILAGVENVNFFSRYAISLGKAFQIRDDINGMFGDVEETGKPIDSDLKQGKKTLLIVRTLENCDENDKKFILKCLDNENITKEDVEMVRRVIKKSGALDYCLKLIDNFVSEAVNSIKNIELRNEGKEFLLGIADFVVNRSY